MRARDAGPRRVLKRSRQVAPGRGVVRVKVCGITRPEDALAAEAAGADALGVILWGRSPRLVDLATAGRALAPVGPFVVRVGVVVDAPAAFIDEAITRLRLGAVQFHGAETASFMGAFQERVALIRAVRYGSWLTTPGSSPGLADSEIGDHGLAPEWLEHGRVDALLVDGPRPGSGEAFDWSAAQRLRSLSRWVLAGGLTPENVAAAVEALDPDGVDVSSGVETSPGIKDHAALWRFVAAAKSTR